MKPSPRTQIALLLPFALLAMPLAAGAAGPKPIRQPGLQAQLVLEKPRILLGEPIYLRFVVKNPTPVAWQTAEGGNQRNRLGRFDDYNIVLRDAAGRALPVRSSAPSFGGIGWAPKIPARGRYERELFLPNWVRFKKGGVYTVTSTRHYRVRKYAKDRWFGENGQKITLTARARLKVLPASKAKLGALIDALGRAMLGRSGRDRALRKLGTIRDARVIRWYVRALSRRRYELKLAAIIALGRFDSDAALAALKTATKVTAADFTGATTVKVAAGLADNVRVAVAQSLASSKHKGAFAALWAMRKDPYASVRLTVLHALSKRPGAETVRRLESMTKDPAQLVRDEAQRYLRQWRKP